MTAGRLGGVKSEARGDRPGKFHPDPVEQALPFAIPHVSAANQQVYA
jgi:hypothetical protein